MKPNPKKRAIILRKIWPRIRDNSSPEKSLFIVDARPHGRREAFTERQDAFVRAEQLALEIENKGTEAIAFQINDSSVLGRLALEEDFHLPPTG